MILGMERAGGNALRVGAETERDPSCSLIVATVGGDHVEGKQYGGLRKYSSLIVYV